MATIPKQAIEVAYTTNGAPPITLTFPEAAAQSFRKGELVFLSSGKVTLCGADPAAVLGIAAHDSSVFTLGTATTDNPCKVWLAASSTVFVANLLGSQTTAVTNVGTAYGVTAASSKWHVDPTNKSQTQVSNSSTSRVIVVGLDTRDNVADIAGRVHFIFLDKTGTSAVLYPLQIQV